VYRCAAVPPERGAEWVIDLIQRLGGQFLDFVWRKPHPDPLATVDDDGNTYSWLHLEHEKLVQDAPTINAIYRKELPPATKGRASISFFRQLRSPCISQDVSSAEQKEVDRIALGQLNFLLFLYPHLRPQYGWVDELGENRPSKESVKTNIPQY